MSLTGRLVEIQVVFRVRDVSEFVSQTRHDYYVAAFICGES